MKRYIYAFAKSRKDIGDEIEDGVRELILHLIKLKLYPNSRDIHKWRREVAEKLHKVSKLKGRHTFPEYEFIMKNSWWEYDKQVPYFIRMIQDDYGKPTEHTDVYELTFCIEDYFIWLCSRLCRIGEVSYESIIQYLSSHGF